MMTTDLPPPAIFTHDETLHRILLPPLATFLSAIRAPEQLVKLNDILTRFRTPKSYHRVDVRLVESSELPPHDTDGEDEGVDGVNGAAGDAVTIARPTKVVSDVVLETNASWKKGKGDPIILPEGVTVEQYLTNQQPQVADAIVATSGHEVNANEGRGGPLDTALVRSEDGSTGLPKDDAVEETISAVPPHLPAKDVEEALNDTIVATRAPSDPLAPSAQPTEPIHPLPPSGPARRVRELRLDLRTLDAAALFALETWRRDILGLEKLAMDHPDSIWYKEATPLPAPSPPLGLVSSGRRRGRPPKKCRESGEGHAVGEALPADGNEAGETRNDVPAGKEVVAERESEDGRPGEKTGGDAGVSVGATEQLGVAPGFSSDVAIPEVTQLEASHADTVIAQPKLAVEVIADEPVAVPESKGEDEFDLPWEPERSPSPDIILIDQYDRNDALDPEFIPPPPPVQRGIRAPQAGEKGFRGGCAGRGGPMRLLPSASWKIDLSPQAGPSNHSVKRKTVASSSDFTLHDPFDDAIDLTEDEPLVQGSSGSSKSGFTPMTFVDMSKPHPRPRLTPALGLPATAVSPLKVRKRRALLESVMIDIPAKRLRGPRKFMHFAPPMGGTWGHGGGKKVVIELDDEEDDEVLVVKRRSTVVASAVAVPDRRPEDDEEWGFLM